jgi:sec-independent protein translocase protein TatC
MSEDNEKEMSFLDHLEELRGSILKSLYALVVGTAISFIFVDFFVNKVLLLPATIAHFKLQNLRPFGQLMMYFQVALVGGLIISLPVIIYQIWKFIAPALHSHEKRYVKSVVFFTTFCFLCGTAFGYFVMLPLTLKFAAGFGSMAIENNFALDEYISIILSIIFAAGLLFELPVLSFFFTKIGMLNPKIMRKYWRHSIVVIMVLAAILSPGTDPVSQIILAIPLVFLYEISIFVSKIAQRKT